MICEFYVSWNAWSAQSAGHVSNRYIFMTIKPCVASENQRNSLCGFGPWQISLCPTSEIYACEKNLTSWIYCFFLLLLLLSFYGFVLFCFFFNNSNISSECDIYSIQSQSLVLYNFALALKQVPLVLNSG